MERLRHVRRRQSGYRKVGANSDPSQSLELAVNTEDSSPQVMHIDEEDDEFEDETCSTASLKRRAGRQLPKKGVAVSYVQFAINEMRQNTCVYLLGFFSCFLVVFTVALLVSLLSHSPVVFMRLAELIRAETDLIVDAGDWTGHSFLNYTFITEVVDGVAEVNVSVDGALHARPSIAEEKYSYSTPRHWWSVKITGSGNCKRKDLDPYELGWKFLPTAEHHCHPERNPEDCFKSNCGSLRSANKLLVLDSEREERISLGREFPEQGKIPKGHCRISSDLSVYSGVHVGGILYVEIPISLLGDLWNSTIESYYGYVDEDLRHVNGTQSFPKPWLNTYIPFVVDTVFSSPEGKYPIGEERVVMIEYETLFEVMAENLHPDIEQPLRTTLGSMNPYHYASQVVFNLPPSRYDFYMSSNFDDTKFKVLEWTNGILYKLGFQSLNSHVPVLDSLSDFQWFTLFLGLILNIIIFILLFLSVLLIYSLMMVSVESKTFQLGILRMVGMKRREIVQLLLTQSFSYSVPSVILGLFFAFLGSIFVSVYFKSLTSMEIDVGLSATAVFAASFLGLLIPILGGILPIRNALAQSLRDCLDMDRNKTTAVEIVIDRSENDSLPAIPLLIGSSFVVFGFMIYYLLPLSLLSLNLTLLINMFVMLLILMLFGLVLLSINFQHIVEKLIVYGGLFWENAAVKDLVLKNLIAHRRRNRMTTIMYAISLAFIIFIVVTYDVQITSVVYENNKWHGTPLRVSSNGNWRNNEGGIMHALSNKKGYEDYLRNSSVVSDWAWISTSVTSMAAVVDITRITTIGHVFRHRNWMYGISPNVFSVCFPGFLYVNAYHDDIPMGIGQQLYSVDGSGGLIVGSLYVDNLGLSLDDEMLVEEWLLDKDTLATTKTGSRFFRHHVLAFLDSAAYFLFSKFPTQTRQDSLFAFPDLLELIDFGILSVDDIPLSVLHIEFVPDATKDQLDQVKRDLNKVGGEDPGASASVRDSRTNDEPIEKANIAMTFFFAFTIVLAMAISFFSLVASMFTNIHEQTKEIGILRSIGMPKFRLIRIYIYEAFTLVLSASTLGLVIGTLVGWTVSLQRVLFTQLPVPFRFPWLMFVMVFVTSTILAVFASW
eukprot:CAMPEP_0174241540 /NCGR_PEP_ID=MMETSP0417-20130205/23696_1 /TAXON_ID=242541 /ORGANISM="Mayorella sp, Strain BSH-02190019" /LENGTH=1110 /DNA_ID=CAMNT_0015320789 /DNA_START=233 /DNA_END=3562 /DNA_ORIENTATION=-